MKIKAHELSDQFFYWLALKYGYGRTSWNDLDDDFQESLLKEYSSIVASY